MPIADTGSIWNAIWWGFVGFFWNWFFLILLIVGVVLLLLLLIRATTNVLSWLFGFSLVRILAGIVLAILLIGMIFSAIDSGIKAYQNSSYNPIGGGPTGCTPAPTDRFPPDNPHDAIAMLCATNVAHTNKIIDGGIYDGVQLLAPGSDTMTAILPANMCIIYAQAKTSFGDLGKVHILSDSNPNVVRAKTRDVVSFRSHGVSVYGNTC